MEDWDLTDASQSRQFLGAQKELHRKRCNEDLEQAQRCCDVLITAQGDVQSGKLRCQDNCPDEVHRLFCLPGTSMKVEKVMLETPPVVKTAGEHNFKTGQNVIITGLKVVAGAPMAVHNLVESLSRDHAVVWVDDCRFSLSSISKLPCEEDEAAEFLDFSEAEVALNVCCWGLGRSSISLSVLLAMSETASASGLGLVASKFYNGLCVSCDSLRNVADTTASHVGHTQRIMPPGTFADGLSWTHHCLRSVSDLKAPDVTLLFSNLWGRMVEKLQPGSWKSAVAADFCAECFQPLGCGSDNERKHHCRNCGRVVCDACSKDRKCVPWEGHFQAVRVCKPCVDVVEIKNLTLKQCAVLREQISLVQTGLYHPKRKGAGKGKPPPPPPKGKGKGKSQGKATPGGLGALASEGLKPTDPEIGDLKDFVLVERPLDFKATRPGAAWQDTQQSQEVLFLTVSMNGCKQHVAEIQHALENVTLEGAEHLESWFGKLDQIIPLEKKFSAQTLARLKAVADEDVGQLSKHERGLRQLLLPVDCLDLRWRTLRLLHELAEPRDQELYWKVLEPTSAAIHAVLSESLELVPEVKSLVALLYGLLKPKCETLPELAARTEVGTGPQLYVKAWERGTERGVNVAAAVDLLLPVLEDEKLGKLHVALENFHAKRLELRSLRSLASAARDSGGCAAARPALEGLEGVLQRVEKGFSDVLTSGGSLLSAFGAGSNGSAVDPLSSSANGVARRVDDHLESLRTLLRGLKASEPRRAASATPSGTTGGDGRRRKTKEVDRAAQSAKPKVLRKRRVTKATFVVSDKVEEPSETTVEIDELSEATVEEESLAVPPRCDRAA